MKIEGSVQQLPSGKWRTRIYHKGKRISITADTLIDLKQKVHEWHLKADREEHEAAEVVRSLGSVVDTYIDNKTNILSPSTIREYRRIRRDDFKTLWGRPADSITKSDCQAVVNDMCAVYSVKTVKNRFGLIRSALKEQCDIEISVKYPQREKKPIHIPSTEDVKRLFAVVRGTSLEIPVFLGALCGMRRGEICAVDKLNADNTITVNKTQVVTETGSYVIKPYAKTEAGNRTVFVPPRVADTMRKHGEPYITLNIDSLTKRFDEMKAKHGFEFRFHDLRHYYASLLMSEGIPDKYVMQRIGHASDYMLKRVYQHTMEEKQKEIDDVVSAKIGDIFDA